MKLIPSINKVYLHPEYWEFVWIICQKNTLRFNKKEGLQIVKDKKEVWACDSKGLFIIDEQCLKKNNWILIFED